MKTKPNKNSIGGIFDEEPILQKSSCSLWTVFVILIIILLIFLGLIFFIKTKNLKPQINLSSLKNTSLSVDQSEITTKNTGDAINIRVTEIELDNVVKSTKDFPLKKPSVKIISTKIIISGKTSDSIFGLTTEVGIVPRINDGSISFDITDIKTAGVVAPKKISDQINQNLSQYLSNLLPMTSSILVTDIKLSEGYLDVVGTKK